MYQPRRASTAADDRIDADAPAFRTGARRAARTRTSQLAARIAPAALTIGIVAGSGALALNLNATEAPTAAVPAPVRADAVTSRQAERTPEPTETVEATAQAAEVSTEESADAAAETAEATAETTVEPGGSWATAFAAVSGEQYAQGDLIVRAQASQDSAELGILAKGDTVSVTDLTVDGYRQVTYDSQVGWVWAERLADEPPAEESAAAAEPETPAASTAASSSTFLWPTAGSISSGWGMRLHPILGYTRLHAGVDIGGSSGQPIYAAADGTVTKAASGYNGGSGNNVRIDHGDVGGKALETGYLHMSTISVSVGQQVTRGQVIGTVGSTGLSTAPHLHFALYVDGTNSDPVPYLND